MAIVPVFRNVSGKVNLYSRNGLVFNDVYPLVVQHLTKMKIDAALDGEIVALNEDGIPDFELLQNYAENPDVPLVYYVFDLIRLNKRDVTGLTLLERKELLRKLIKNNPVIRYSDHVEEHGIDFFHTAVEKNLEGIMAKKNDSNYFIGTRSSNWLKIKKDQKTDEAIIIGFTDPRKSRKYFGSLVLAQYERWRLRYVVMSEPVSMINF
jgi:bifunctional non-homologous end joining protein LigD